MRVSEWQPIAIDPKFVGWYDYRGFLIEPAERLYWNGSQWGFWMGGKKRQKWVQMAECITDQWRGKLAGKPVKETA